MQRHAVNLQQKHKLNTVILLIPDMVYNLQCVSAKYGVAGGIDLNFPALDVAGKVAIVTGGSKGIGFGMAQALAQYGADIVVACRNISEGEKAADTIKKLGRRAMAIRCDVTKKLEVEDMVSAVINVFGRIDILLNNAGMNIRKPAVEIEEEDFDRVIETNLKGVFLVAQAVGKQMVRQKKGKIINISSIMGGVGFPWLASYCSSKGGINQLTKVLALEWAPYNINVNAIAPAYIRTPMTSGWLSDKERYKTIIDSTPLGRVGDLEDLAGPVVFLASEASNYVTGHVLYVDGGWLAK